MALYKHAVDSATGPRYTVCAWLRIISCRKKGVRGRHLGIAPRETVSNQHRQAIAGPPQSWPRSYGRYRYGL